MIVMHAWRGLQRSLESQYLLMFLHTFLLLLNDFSTVLEYCVPCGSLAGVYRMFVHLRGTLYMPMSAFVSWLKEWPSLQVPAVAKVGK